MTRDRLSTFFVILTFVLTIVSGPIWYAGEFVREEDRFVAVADRILSHPSVRKATAEQVTMVALEAFETDEAIAELLPGQGRALAVPISRLASEAITDAAFDVLDSEIAKDARNSALREVHRQVTADSEEVTIDLRAVTARTTRELAGPTAASAVTQFLADSDSGRLTVAEPGSDTAQVVKAIRSLEGWGLFFGVATVLVLVLGVAVARDRRGALVRVGLTFAAATTVSVVLVAVLLQATPLLTDSPLGHDIGRGIAESIATDFGRRQRGGVVGGFVIATLGLLLGRRSSAVALRSLPHRLWVRDRAGLHAALSSIILDNPPLARVVCWTAPALIWIGWPTPTWRVAISILVATALLQLGIWYFASPRQWATARRDRYSIPSPSLETTSVGERSLIERVNLGVVIVAVLLVWPGWSVTVLGWFFVILSATQALLDIRPARRLAHVNAIADPAFSQHAATWSPRHYMLAGAVFTAAVVGIVAATLLSNDVVSRDIGCNGHVALCEKRIDEIVWAGSHNSMSSSELGWELAAQTGDMVAQLDHGVRALLIDTHYWDGSGAFEGGDDVEAAAIIEAAVEDDRPQPGTWLCHGPCALGATDLVAGLTSVDLWLEEHQTDVLIFVVQDETTTADTVAAFEDSGLADRAHDHEPGTPWPTLRELIDQNERILVYAENEGSPDSWYQNAWETAFFDTPFSFAVRSDFSCIVNRGQKANGLLLNQSLADDRSTASRSGSNCEQLS